MLDWMFIIFFILAVLLMILAIENEDHPYWNIVSSSLSAIFWLILSLSQMEIEIPYQLYNATSGNLETGYHLFTSPMSVYLVYIFIGMFWVMIIYTIVCIFNAWVDYKEGE